MENLRLLQGTKINDFDPKPKKFIRTYRQRANYTVGGDLYNRKYTFNLQKNYGLLKKQFVKVTIDIAAVTKGIDPFGTSIFSLSELKVDGLVIQRLNNYLLESKIALLKDTPLGVKIDNGLVAVIAPGNHIIYVPLLWFFSEREEYFTSEGQVSVSLTTGANAAEMGLNGVINSIVDVELISHYDQVNNNTEQIKLKEGLDMFKEDSTTVIVGQTSAKVLLRCEYKVKNLHMLLRSTIGDKDYQINNVLLESNLGTSVEIDKNTNYSFLDNNLSSDYSTSFTLNFGSNDYNEDFVTFEDSMTPTFVTVNFDAIVGADAVLHIMSEYKTKIEYSGGVAYSHA